MERYDTCECALVDPVSRGQSDDPEFQTRVSCFKCEDIGDPPWMEGDLEAPPWMEREYKKVDEVIRQFMEEQS